MKKKTTTKKKSEPTSVPGVQPGYHNIALSEEDCNVLIQVLAASTQVFEQVAVAAEPNSELQRMYQARSQLSALLFSKLKRMLFIGEPTSREIH
jgi:hypothetical protein